MTVFTPGSGPRCGAIRQVRAFKSVNSHNFPELLVRAPEQCVRVRRYVVGNTFGGYPRHL
jgi:hypothetical protein